MKLVSNLPRSQIIPIFKHNSVYLFISVYFLIVNLTTLFQHLRLHTLASNDMISERWIIKVVEGNGRGLIYATIPASKAVSWLRPLVADLSSQRPGFAPGSIHVGFVVDKVALGQVFLRVLRFSPVNIIPPSLSKLISSGGWTICPIVAAVQRRSLTPSKSIPASAWRDRGKPRIFCQDSLSPGRNLNLRPPK
jgi:hypothetical protein